MGRGRATGAKSEGSSASMGPPGVAAAIVTTQLAPRHSSVRRAGLRKFAAGSYEARLLQHRAERRVRARRRAAPRRCGCRCASSCQVGFPEQPFGLRAAGRGDVVAAFRRRQRRQLAFGAEVLAPGARHPGQVGQCAVQPPEQARQQQSARTEALRGRRDRRRAAFVEPVHNFDPRERRAELRAEREPVEMRIGQADERDVNLFARDVRAVPRALATTIISSRVRRRLAASDRPRSPHRSNTRTRGIAGRETSTPVEFAGTGAATGATTAARLRGEFEAWQGMRPREILLNVDDDQVLRSPPNEQAVRYFR